MEYLKDAEDGSVSFAKYFEFLQSIKGSMPSELQSYALEYGHYNLSSHSSLHDAWLITLTVAEIGSGERNEDRRVDIGLRFLGPFHDKELLLSYLGVSRYSIRSPSIRGGHGDVMIHEFRRSSDGSFLHEIAFVTGSEIIVEFTDFAYEERAVDLRKQQILEI